jgi:amidohydrolase
LLISKTKRRRSYITHPTATIKHLKLNIFSMSLDWKIELDRVIDAQADEVIGLRRYLHAHPEPSGEELKTSLHLYQLLGELGLDVRMGPQGCGVLADSTDPRPTEVGAKPIRRVAFRADLDALRIQDAKDVAYRSVHEGLMHACGHDSHTAIAYGVARTLDTLGRQDQLPWTVAWRALFQPAEETATGACQMIKAGALEDVGAMVALHVEPTRQVGEIAIRSGALTAHCDSLHIVIHGQGGHAARPHESKDPIAAAAQLISTLYQFVPRATDSLDAVVVTIGRIRGGETSNVIPDVVDLWGTVRTLSGRVRGQTIEQIRQLARGIEEITGTQIDVRLEVSIPSVHNDTELTRLVSQAAAEVVGEEHVQRIPQPSMGSEDFACYLENIPGVMFRLGSASDLAVQTGLHTPLFDIDERALAIGTKIITRAVVMAAQNG